MNFLISPFVNALFGFYYLTGSLGWSIVIVTILIRLILMPLLWPSLKSANKMRELQPKLKRLQEKYGKEKEKLAKAQMDLYKQEGVNPLSGCLPQILQIAVLIIFFSAFNLVTAFSEGKKQYQEINSHLVPYFQIKDDFRFGLGFLGTSLTSTPAKDFAKGISEVLLVPVVLLLGSGLLQYWSSKMMMPSSVPSEPRKGKPAIVNINQSAYTKATAGKSDDMMEAMRVQSLYMMPLMTIVIGWNFSVGILLYWFVNSLVMAGQQIVVIKFQR